VRARAATILPHLQGEVSIVTQGCTAEQGENCEQCRAVQKEMRLVLALVRVLEHRECSCLSWRGVPKGASHHKACQSGIALARIERTRG
jgi:hypothetical protein